MNDIISRNLYPVCSILIIEFGKVLEHFSNLMDMLIIFVQLSIGILTIIKIYIDIKKKTFRSINSTEKKIKRKYPFLKVLKNYLTLKKKL